MNLAPALPIAALLFTALLTASDAGAEALDWGEAPIGGRIELDRIGLDPLVIGPADGRGDRPRYDRLTVSSDGLIDLSVGRAAPLVPGALDAGFGPLVAPFWFDFDGPCPTRPERNTVRYAVEDGALVVRWLGMTVGGTACDPGAPTFEFAAMIESTPGEGDGPDGLRITFEYVDLPDGGAPRAGVVLGALALELLPDEEKPRTDRAALLREWGSEGVRGHEGEDRAYEAGVWIIELDADGAVVGDRDADGFRSVDNCPEDFNPGQENLIVEPGDRPDLEGDACDVDDDDDQARDAQDNCPTVSNRQQTDLDGDGRGDACDLDDDGDLVGDAFDNCPSAYNPGQFDLDRDARGDVCDADPDGDGIPTVGLLGHEGDTCPWVADSVQKDGDGDDLGDRCDTRPTDGAVDGGRIFQADADGDTWPDIIDICPLAADPEQSDADGDGLGDACDADADGDWILDIFQGRCFSSALGLLGRCDGMLGIDVGPEAPLLVDIGG